MKQDQLFYKPFHPAISKMYYINQRLINKLSQRFAHAGHTTIIRPMIEYINEHYINKPLIGAEIGVRDGFNMRYIFNTLNIKCLYVVDIEFNNRLKQNIKQYKDKVIFLNMDSAEATEYIPDDLDFCYIDGDHTYQGVKRDVNAYFPKIKTGGIIGGHDYTIQHYGLVKAVSEFLMKLKEEKDEVGEGIFSGQMFQDWWVVK